MRIKTTFEYWINDTNYVLIEASAKDVDSIEAVGLKLRLPEDFKPTREVADEIEEMAISKLYETKYESELRF